MYNLFHENILFIIEAISNISLIEFNRELFMFRSMVCNCEAQINIK